MVTGAGSHAYGMLSTCFNSHMWFMLCLIYIFCLELVVLFRDRDWLCRLGPISMFLSENGDRVYPSKRVNKNRTVDNVRKGNHGTVVKPLNFIKEEVRITDSS
jgi:hypothetical protein